MHLNIIFHTKKFVRIVTNFHLWWKLSNSLFIFVAMKSSYKFQNMSSDSDSKSSSLNSKIEQESVSFVNIVKEVVMKMFLML